MSRRDGWIKALDTQMKNLAEHDWRYMYSLERALAARGCSDVQLHWLVTKDFGGRALWADATGVWKDTRLILYVERQIISKRDRLKYQQI